MCYNFFGSCTFYFLELHFFKLQFNSFVFQV